MKIAVYSSGWIAGQNILTSVCGRRILWEKWILTFFVYLLERANCNVIACKRRFVAIQPPGGVDKPLRTSLIRLAV